MDVTLTPDQEAFIAQAVKSGRFGRVEDALAEALMLWEDRERLRSAFMSSLDEARASIERGEGMPVSQASMRNLAGEIKQRGRERLALAGAATT